jgi:2',3'-cyclic-nucleotide 2'-phosphodiesterase/3'-nucleotidase
MALFLATLAGARELQLRVLATTDLHSQVFDYDYFTEQKVDKHGLVRTSALIHQARAEVKNSILIDNGDFLQGSPLIDYYLSEIKNGQKLANPVIQAMNRLQYDVGNLGNHEFNYGLGYLQQALSEAHFPVVNANIYAASQENAPLFSKHLFKPYVVLNRNFTAADGSVVPLKIGVIGVAPPQIMVWDRVHLTGKAMIRDMVAETAALVPEVRGEGVDMLIVAAHTGLGTETQTPNGENVGYQLSRIKGVDAVVMGHAHLNFPDAKVPTGAVPGVDYVRGFVGGVPMVMAGYWGNNLGLIDFQLTEERRGRWKVKTAEPALRSVADAPTARDEEMAREMLPVHEATQRFLRQPIGSVQHPLTSYFALVVDDPSIELINAAQRWYVKSRLEGSSLSSLPLLSATAPFRAGGLDPTNYVEIPAGPLSLKDASSLYVFANTLQVVKVTGKILKEWLEMAAGAFNAIDPERGEPQQLINPDFRAYNFDVIDGVSYQIDVRQAPKYDPKGALIHPTGSRIVNLSYQGKPIREEDLFLVCTNNYRASGGGNFPGLDGSSVVLDPAELNRTAVVEYAKANPVLKIEADHNWSLVPFSAKGPIVFSSGSRSRDFIPDPSFKLLKERADGFVDYSIF